MAAPRFGGSGSAPKKGEKSPRPVKFSRAWPPVEWDMHATLVQNGCVKCRRQQFTVRHFRAEGKVLWEDDCASVCDACWGAVIVATRKHGDLEKAFWEAKPVRPNEDDRLVNMLEYQPTKKGLTAWLQYKQQLATNRYVLKCTT